MMPQALIWLSLLVVLDGLLIILRAALLYAHPAQLDDLARERGISVEAALRQLKDAHLRVSLRFALAILHLLLGAGFWQWVLAPRLIAPLLAVLWLLLAALAIAVLEYLLEGLVLHHPEAWLLRLRPFNAFFGFLLRPVAALLIALRGGQGMVESLKRPVTEDELRAWVEDESTPGALEKGEREMIYSIFQFGDTLCREIMVPRIDILALEANASIDEAIQAFTQSGHSRVPVYEETIDNIIGLLYAKDLLRIRLEGEPPPNIRPFLRPAYFVPESKKVDDLLREMQARSIHMAIVVDEYGGTAGLVTLEDIVEEIVGEIRDEYDQSEEPPFQQLNPNEYLLHGRLSLDDLNDLLDTALDTDLADTLGGYIYSVLGRVPSEGEQVRVGEWIFMVEQVSGRRIRRVRAVRQPPPSELQEESHDPKRRDAPAVDSHSA